MSRSMSAKIALNSGSSRIETRAGRSRARSARTRRASPLVSVAQRRQGFPGLGAQAEDLHVGDAEAVTTARQWPDGPLDTVQQRVGFVGPAQRLEDWNDLDGNKVIEPVDARRRWQKSSG